MKKIPISVLSQRFGNIGKRIWMMAQGLDSEAIQTKVQPPKTVGASKVLPPNTTDRCILDEHLYYCSEKVSFRLRNSGIYTKRCTIGISLTDDSILAKFEYITPINDSKSIYKSACEVLDRWNGEGSFKVSICADQLVDQSQIQKDLFCDEYPNSEKEDTLRDTVNTRFGVGTLKTAKSLMSKGIGEVIPPSWKPKGVRNSISGSTTDITNESFSTKNTDSQKKGSTKRMKVKTYDELQQKALKKNRQLKNEDNFKKRKKIFRHLIYHGASVDIANKICKDLFEWEV